MRLLGSTQFIAFNQSKEVFPVDPVLYVQGGTSYELVRWEKVSWWSFATVYPKHETSIGTSPPSLRGNK